MRDSFIHPELNKRIEFFGGGYMFVEEGKFIYQGKEVLYLKGVADIETSCCGGGGGGFIKVPGYIHSWKKAHNEMGRPISEVESIEAPDQQKEISDILSVSHPGFSQIEVL